MVRRRRVRGRGSGGGGVQGRRSGGGGGPAEGGPGAGGSGARLSRTGGSRAGVTGLKNVASRNEASDDKIGLKRHLLWPLNTVGHWPHKRGLNKGIGSRINRIRQNKILKF